MKKVAILVMMSFLVACGKSNEERMAAIQPCLAQGIDIDRCTQAYNGRAPGDSTNWLGMLAAAGAGAALNHALTNKSPQYSAPQQYAPVQSYKPVPNIQGLPAQQAQVLNKAQIIPAQKAQPLFVPNVVAKSLTPAPASLSNATSVYAPAKSVSVFKPSSASVFKPSSPKRK